jgi:DNA repair exonuclease SbcCD ATPase subunit
MSSYRLRFTRLQGTNVCSYAKFDIPLEGQGTVLLTGVNGSGKSTPWYALTNVLYSDTPKGLKYGNLINVHDPHNYWVRVDFELDGIPYAIEQYRDHDVLGTGFTIFRHGNDITPHGIDATKKYIPELIDISYRDFLSKIFLSQEDTHVLMEGKPAQKRDHIMHTFGLLPYKQLGDLAKQHKEEATQQIKDMQRSEEEMYDIERQLRELPTLTRLKQKLNKLKEERADLASEVKVLQTRKSQLAHKVSKLEVRDELVDELRELNISGSPTPTDVASLRQKVDTLADRMASLNSSLKLAQRAETLRSELDKYTELPPASKLRQDLEDVRSRKMMLTEVTLPGAQEAHRLRIKLNKIKREEDPEELGDQELELEKKIRRIETALKALNKQVKKGICPTCKRPWKATPEDLRKAKAKRDDARAALDRTNKTYYALHARAKDARQRVDLRARLEKLPEKDPQDVELEIEQLHLDEKDIRADLALAEEREKIEAQIKGAPRQSSSELSQRLKRTKHDLKDARDLHSRTSKAHDLLRRISALPSGDREKLEDKLLRMEGRLDDASKRTEELIEEITNTKVQGTRVKKLMQRRDDLGVEMEQSKAAKRDSRIYQALQEGFRYVLQMRERTLLKRITKELPAYLIPLFGEQSDWVRAELTKDKSGVDLQVMSGDRVLPTHGPSPGQRAKLGVALLFAIRDLYARGSCNLLVLDEPLWRMDEESRPAFLDLVENIKSRVETLVITTHEGEIKGHSFNHKWEATIHDGISTLTLN